MAIKFVDKEPEEPKSAARRTSGIKPERPAESVEPDPSGGVPAGQRPAAKPDPKSARKRVSK